MEVLDKGKYKLLSNHEVNALLKEVNADVASSNIKNQNLSTIVYEVEKYLASSPCGHQNNEIIKQIKDELKLFKLTKAEKLQIINQRPTSEVEIALIVEESEERLTEEEVAKLIEISLKLPFPEEEVNENAEEEETEES